VGQRPYDALVANSYAGAQRRQPEEAMTIYGELLSALFAGLDEKDRTRTAELITRGVAADLNAVGNRAPRRVDYGTRQRRSGLSYERHSARVEYRRSGGDLATDASAGGIANERG
jgi:hypothetical protein